MTIKNLVIVGLNDIRQIQIECQCGASFSYNPDKEILLPHTCHQCHGRWKDDFKNSYDLQLMEAFLKAIREIRSQQRANNRMTIKFVLEDADSTDPSSSPNEQ